jgi:FKBP-type peptidyl-prolyl cis-trans isomerase FklB
MKNHNLVSSIPAGAACLLIFSASNQGVADPPAPAPAATPEAAQAPPAKRPAAPAAADNAVPNPEEGGYLIGLNFGEQLHRLGITNEISSKDIARGINDALAGKKFDPANQQRIQAYVKSVVDRVVARNRAAAAKFLAENAKAEGVQSLPSGLEYRVITPGDPTGPSPTATDQVTVQYRGKLVDGTEFDSSYTRGQPATFTLNGVIKGWQEGVALMKPGAKWELFVPPELGYDAVPKPGIPGGSLLIFDVELVGIKPAATPSAPPPGAGPPPKTQDPTATSGHR